MVKVLAKVVLCVIAGRLISDSSQTVEVRGTLSGVLQLALLSEDVVAVCNHDPHESFIGLLRNLETLDNQLCEPVAKSVCNFFYLTEGNFDFCLWNALDLNYQNQLSSIFQR
jgi:hypothetical protein